MQSASVSALVDKLQHLVTEETPFQAVLTVFLGERGGKKGRGMSVKFRLDDTKWVPMKHLPVRVAHGLYSISLDNDTAFRIRACSREPSMRSDLPEASLDSVLISSPPDGCVFDTAVEPGPNFPSSLKIRGFSVKKKTHIDSDGLRFTFSYMNATHTDTKVECRLIPHGEDAKNEKSLSPSETMRALVDKVLALLDHKD